MKGELKVKEPLLQRYYHLVSGPISIFDLVCIKHLRQENNTRVNLLLRVATAKKKIYSSIGYICYPKKPKCQSREMYDCSQGGNLDDTRPMFPRKRRV